MYRRGALGLEPTDRLAGSKRGAGAIERHTDQKWVRLYVERWVKAAG
jgi:hypothetical protein